MLSQLKKQAESAWTEAEAIRQAKNGDAAGFEYLYNAHSRRVYSLCLRMIRNPAEADDLTQQTFLQLFRKIATFRGESGFSTWLHRVTVNVVLLHLRRRKSAPTFEDLGTDTSVLAGADAQSSFDNSMFSAIDRLNLKRAVTKLAPGYKQFFLLYDVLGYEHKEIAKILGCSVGCSKSQLHKARQRLRGLLQGEHREKRLNSAPRGREIRTTSKLWQNADSTFRKAFSALVWTDYEI
jgi:RNA polymerase sigma-70 factor, ECF subfamily